jgi:DNA-binding NarL/FixJ family response regulator
VVGIIDLWKICARSAQGLTNKEIASQLNPSEFTVKNHLYRTMKQVDAGTRYEAVETVRAQLDEV